MLLEPRRLSSNDGLSFGSGRSIDLPMHCARYTLSTSSCPALRALLMTLQYRCHQQRYLSV